MKTRFPCAVHAKCGSPRPQDTEKTPRGHDSPPGVRTLPQEGLLPLGLKHM